MSGMPEIQVWETKSLLVALTELPEKKTGDTIYNSQVLEATEVPISKRVDPKTMVYLHNGILRSRETQGAYTLYNSMDEKGEHYAK